MHTWYKESYMGYRGTRVQGYRVKKWATPHSYVTNTHNPSWVHRLPLILLTTHSKVHGLLLTLTVGVVIIAISTFLPNTNGFIICLAGAVLVGR